jgi:Uncharacterised nucleotidyltransferase
MEKSLPRSDQLEVTVPAGEWPVLLECASPACDSERLRELTRDVDWPRLLYLAEEHGILGLLRMRLGELDENMVPTEIRRKLLELHRLQVFSTLRITAELFRLLELFAANGIGALVVKGPALAVQAYGDPGLRSYRDLDLLVPERDIRRATESLEASGYQATVPLGAIEAGKIPGQYLFFHPETESLIELHNDLTLRYFPRRLPLEKFFARHIQVRLDAREIPALSVEDELVYLCIHGTKHFWERLSWIADVAALVTRQSGINWQGARETAQEVRAERMMHTGLRLASDLLHAPLPADVLLRVQRDVGAGKLAACVRTWLLAGETAPTLFERAVFRLRMRGDRLAAPAYLLRLSLSPTEEDWQGAGETSHSRWVDAFRRPFRLARKYGRGGKSAE